MFLQKSMYKEEKSRKGIFKKITNLIFIYLIIYSIFYNITLKTSVLLLHVNHDSNFLGIWSVYF